MISILNLLQVGLNNNKLNKYYQKYNKFCNQKIKTNQIPKNSYFNEKSDNKLNQNE